MFLMFRSRETHGSRAEGRGRGACAGWLPGSEDGDVLGSAVGEVCLAACASVCCEGFPPGKSCGDRRALIVKDGACVGRDSVGERAA